MKNNSNNQIIYSLIIVNLILIAFYLFSKLNFIIEPMLTILNAMFLPLVLAVFLYYLVRPLKRFFEKQKFSSGISTAISMMLVILLIVSITFYATSIIRTQGQGLISSIVDSLENLTEKYAYIFPQLGDMLNIGDLTQKIIEYLSNSFVSISKNIFGFATSISNFVAQAVLIPIIMFYILKDDKKLFGTFTSFIPRRPKTTLLKILNEIDTVLKQYITSQVMVASVIGILMFIGYVFIRMPNALVLAMFSLITAFIPFLGVVLGILPAIIISLGMGFPMLIKVIILTIVVQQLEGNVITPNITGNKLNMHPLTTILVVTTSVYFGGFFAAFLAVPIYNIVKIVIKNIYDYFMLKSKIDIETK